MIGTAAEIQRPWRELIDEPLSTDQQGPDRSSLSDDVRLNVLLFCDEHSRHIGTVEDHIQAMVRQSRHNVLPLDARGAGTIDVDLDRFDVIITHYSVAIGLPGPLPLPIAEKLKAFTGLKMAFLQDEYRWIDDSAAAIRDLGIKVLFTVTNPEVTRTIYHHPWFDDIRIEHTLTGFCPEPLLDQKVPRFEKRPIDIGYRARKVPNWLGEASQEKWTIGERFKVDAPAYGLTSDISSREQDRLYGDHWIKFLSRCKAVLGTESSISAFDFDGSLKEKIEAYEREHPDVSFAELKERFLAGIDGCHGTISVVSPRVFEAAALKTLMILYPGNYSGVLEPWRHYVPLARDHGNMPEVAETLKSQARVSEITECCYLEVARSGRWGYNSFAAHFDRVIDEVAVARTSMPVPVTEADGWQRQIKAKLRREARRVALSQFFVKSSRRAAAFVNEDLPAPVAQCVKWLGRPIYRAMRYIARRTFLPRST
ncbi:MAG: hypothetical protein ACR2QF_04225 [Geminicoccaceae bacterium]